MKVRVRKALYIRRKIEYSWLIGCILKKLKQELYYAVLGIKKRLLLAHKRRFLFEHYKYSMSYE
ncbi:hypothetical protein AT270_30380 [Bacillus cereus]|nr:hypothetical protein AT270_30380 [Bacillus cereus]MBG9937295.1 hypothetical protein [Bacillus tropicus]OTY57581.1 hypothetical protein BK748_14025 [Bacillus thuringiensis serovar graciosensis]